MAPKRRATTTQPSRRSTRIASRASSVAAESTENNDAPVASTKSKRNMQRKSKKAQANVFKAAVVIARIRRGDLAIIKTLTQEQKDAVIVGFRDITNDLSERVHELEQRNEVLKAERDRAQKAADRQITLRDAFFKDRLKETRERLDREAREQEEQQGAKTPVTEKALQTPVDKKQELVQAETAPAKISFNQTVEIHSVSPQTTSPIAPPTPSPGSSFEQPQDGSTPKLQKSLFGRFLSTISSPFTARRTSVLTSSQTQTPQEVPQKPLGELGTNRKRRAEEPALEEPASEKAALEAPVITTAHTPKPARTPRHVNTLPSARHPTVPSALNTITERSELTEESVVMVDPTPSRAPRSVTKMRREAREKEKLVQTPGRAWSQKPIPREANADARLAKLRHFQELNRQVEALKADGEIQEMVPRPVKRVKIDKLVSIPHNRPGDPSSTFRVYDVDSDDEMEVDADEEIRDNIFELQPTQQTEAESTLPAAPAAEPIQPTEPTQPAEPTQLADPTQPAQPAIESESQAEAPGERPKMVFNFPSMGRDGPTYKDLPPNPLALLKFKYGLALYLEKGELIKW